jgi:ABC-type glycerol-3-phosphate transport system substrate-binding protein
MAQPTSNFKLIFISVFIVAAIGGILVFSGIINIGGSSGTTSVSGTAVLWGTIPESSLATYLDDFGIRNQQVHVTYVQKDPATYEQALVEAIASGNPPDLVLLPDNLIWRFRNKLTHIPFTSLPASTFQATFVDSANVFGMSDGYSAIPWAVDPLILYYNKDLLSSAGIAKPPTTWKEFVDTIPLLAKKENDLTITQSATALGTYKNIAHAKDILALLLLQSGNNFITTNPTTG